MRSSRRCILRVFVAGIVLFCGSFPAMATEDPQSLHNGGKSAVGEREEPAVSFAAGGAYFLGYRWFASEDEPQAAEYVYPHSSLTFGLDFLSCPLPYRYHVNAEFLSEHNLYADAGFAYQDLVLFRDILVGAHHNLPRFDYRFPGEPPGLRYSDRNPGDSYYVDFFSNLLSLRLKAPEFPLHAFWNHRHIERSGKVQQRFLRGYLNQVELVSQSREIDWKSNVWKLGTNSHVGPVEIEYAYERAGFRPGADNILHDSYPAAAARPADVYPHNVVPETEAAGHTLKLHSSYTGGIVAAATLGTLSQQNNYSLVESTTRKGAFDFSWIPDPMVGLFFKYRHRSVDMDNPGAVTVSGLSNGSILQYPVRKAISYDRDIFSLSTRYRPLGTLALSAAYEFSHLQRKDVGEWLALPGYSNVQTVYFSAQARPLARVKATASYEYKNYSQPAYNSTPDNSSKLRLATTYTPTPGTNLFLEYILALTERDALYYLNPEPALLLEAGERSGRHDQFLVSLSTELSPRLSLSLSWFHHRREVKQDLAFGRWSGGGGGLPYIDAGVPYAERADSLSLGLHCLPRQDISVGADVSHTISEATTGYHDVLGGAPFALSSFSVMKASETVFSLEIAKKLSKEWELGLRSHFAIYNDRAYDLLDGSMFAATFRVKRYF